MNTSHDEYIEERSGREFIGGRFADRSSTTWSTRPLRGTIVSGILLFVLMLVVLQLWLLTATMNAFLGGDDSVVWPAAVASFVCLGLNVGLLVYLYRIDRT